MKSKVVAYIERDSETGCYVAIVPGIPGAHTQADTLDELQIRLKEVVELCLQEMNQEERDLLPEFVGVQQIEVAVWVNYSWLMQKEWKKYCWKLVYKKETER